SVCGAGSQQRQSEAGRGQRRFAGSDAAIPCECALCGTTRGERIDRIRDAVEDSVVNTPDGTGIVNHAVGLPALDDDDALNGPTVSYLPFPGCGRKELRKFIVII